MRRLSRSHTHDQCGNLSDGLVQTIATLYRQPPRSHSPAPVAVCVPEAEGSYERGAALGCPDCMGGEEHCCPFIWADQQAEPLRSWALGHMLCVLADEIAEAQRWDDSVAVCVSGRWS